MMADGRTDRRIHDPDDDGEPDDLLCTTLDSGIKIPKLGMWDALTRSASRDIDKALQSGYRHIVLSSKLDKDRDISDILARWLKKAKPAHKREHLFISVMFDLGPAIGLSNARQMISHRVQSLDCQYVDMVILHKPDTFKLGDNLRQRNTLATTWKNLEKLVSENVVRCLGLSNFRQEELESVLAACTIGPDVLWFCSDPTQLDWLDTDQARRYCQYKGLRMGVLNRVDRPDTEWVRSHGTALGTISKQHRKTSIQVYHRMLLQKNILVAIAVESRTLEPSFKVFDFHLPREDIMELANVTL